MHLLYNCAEEAIKLTLKYMQGIPDEQVGANVCGLHYAWL